MSNYPPNEVVDILLILNECHRNYRRAARIYIQQYLNRWHPADRQICNIEIRILQESIANIYLKMLDYISILQIADSTTKFQ